MLAEKQNLSDQPEQRTRVEGYLKPDVYILFYIVNSVIVSFMNLWMKGKFEQTNCIVNQLLQNTFWLCEFR